MKTPRKQKSPRRSASAAPAAPVTPPAAPTAPAAPPADDSSAAASPSGGRVNNRGVLIQTLVALLDALLGKSPCRWLSLEPGDVDSEKFDLTYEDAKAVHAVQVKSSSGEFTRAFAEGVARQMMAEKGKLAPGVRCRLTLVGHPAKDLIKVRRLDGVSIDLRTPDEAALLDQAAHRLHRFMDAQKLRPVKAEFQELLVGHLTTLLLQASIHGRRLETPELIEQLRRWVTGSPHYHPEEPEDDLSQTLATYFDHVIGTFGKLPLAGIDPKAGDPETGKRLDLAAVYIELSTDRRRPPREGETSPRRGLAGMAGVSGAEHAVPVSALEAASEHWRLVLTGQPGWRACISPISRILRPGPWRW